MTRTNRTRRWRKATVLALCVVYGLVLLHPTTPDAAVTPLEWVVIGTTVASFLFDQYRSIQSGPDPTATAVIQNRRMLEELHARFDTYEAVLSGIAQRVVNIPVEVRRDVNQALDLYRLREVNGLRTRIADCAELEVKKIKCDMNLKQLWTDYGIQTAAFFEHGGLTAIALPELYEFERWYLYVTGKDSELRLRQLNDNYEAAVREALTVGELPKGMQKRSKELKSAYDLAMRRYDVLAVSNCPAACPTGLKPMVDTTLTRDMWDSRTNDFVAASFEYERQAEWYTIYKEVTATLLVFSDRRLGVDLSHAQSWHWHPDRDWASILNHMKWNNHERSPTVQCISCPPFISEWKWNHCQRACRHNTNMDCLDDCYMNTPEL